jgi:hypothetical protein
MSDEITTKPNHGEPLLTPEGFAQYGFQNFLDDLQQRMNDRMLGSALILEEYIVATVPAAADWDNGAIIVADEAGGRTIATSDGTNWRRVSDGAVIS